MSIQHKITFQNVEWLTLDQVCTLLEKGDIVLACDDGITHLYIDWVDRITAGEFVRKFRPKQPTEKEET
jgi:hypothetical protein